MNLFAFLLHLIVDVLLGFGILNYTSKNLAGKEKFSLALLLGMLVETSFCFWVMWIGSSHKVGFIIVILFALILHIPIFKEYKFTQELLKKGLVSFKTSLSNFLWYDWLLIVLIAEKFFITIWQLVRMPVYHSDTIKHWATQGHAIYASINFSMDAAVPEFMAKHLTEVPDYPLQLPLWAANNAFLAGGWSDFSARSFGLLLLIGLTAVIYTAFKSFSKRNWLALGATLFILALPLQVWHAASGYGDFAVEVFLAGALFAFIRKEWIISGLLIAGAGWSKNDGIAVFFTAFTAMFFVYQLSENKYSIKNKLLNIGQFLLGYVIILPWLIFQGQNYQTAFGKIFKPIINLFNNLNSNSAEQVPKSESELNITEAVEPVVEATKDSLTPFYDFVITGSTHGFFWLFFFLGLILLTWHFLKDKMGRSLLVFVFVSLGTIYYIFTFTPAYEYLIIQTTIHRTMLQFSAAALLILGFGLSLYLENLVPMTNKVKAKKERRKRKSVERIYK